MTFRRFLLPQKVAAIVVLIALAVNQWRFVLRFHNHDFIRQQAENLPQSLRTTSNKNTKTTSHCEEDYFNNTEIAVVNEIIHRAFFGLGHRLHRSAAAYHLAESISLPPALEPSTTATSPTHLHHYQYQPVITHLRFHWESCLSSEEVRNSNRTDENQDDEIEYNVFRYLFGDDLWKLNLGDSVLALPNTFVAPKGNSSDNKRNTIGDIATNSRRNMIVLRNDIPGYIAGQLYKDLKIPVDYNPNRPSQRNKRLQSNETARTNNSKSRHLYDVMLDKVMRSDVEFYERLEHNYRFQSEIEEFQIKHKWNERPLVIGLHLRAGNGEDAHFAESGRASLLETDESIVIARLLRLIEMLTIREIKIPWKQSKDSEQNRRNYENDSFLRPLLFIATDTAHLLPMIDEVIEFVSKENRNDYDGHFESKSHEAKSINTTSTSPSLTSFEILTWPQDRLPKDTGVSFDTLRGKGKRCLEGWRSSMSDALLLSKVDILIAAKRSTFTQSLPLTLAFNRNQRCNYDHENIKDFTTAKSSDKKAPQSKEIVTGSRRKFTFCEVSEPDATHMTCYSDMRAWLFQGEDEQIGPTHAKDDDARNKKKNKKSWSFSLPNSSSDILDRKPTYQHASHKLTVLLPDLVPPPEFEQAREFLRENSREVKSAGYGTEKYESIFRYGKSKINKKYRSVHETISKANCGWNLIPTEELTQVK